MDFSILNKMTKKMKAFDTDLVLNQSVKKHSAVILRMNFEDQLYNKGVFPDGIGTGDYSPFTVKMKKAPGSHDHRTDHITFKDEGDFYKGGYVKITKNGFEPDSKDSKRDELVRREGDMFGLIPENLNELARNYFLPDLQMAAKKAV